METKTLFAEVVENTTLTIDGTGRLVITNTGGQSAGEGGMGSSSDSDTSKGDLADDGERSGLKDGDENDENWDPIGKNIKEKEKENSGDE